jgi:hypothetical protein
MRNVQGKLQYVQLSLSTRHKGTFYLREQPVQDVQN